MGNMLAAIVGVVCGAIGASPYPIVLTRLKRKGTVSVLPGVVAVGVSLLVSMVMLLVGKLVAGEGFVAYGIAFLVLYVIVVAVAIALFAHEPRH